MTDQSNSGFFVVPQGTPDYNLGPCGTPWDPIWDPIPQQYFPATFHSAAQLRFFGPLEIMMDNATYAQRIIGENATPPRRIMDLRPQFFPGKSHKKHKISKNPETF